MALHNVAIKTTIVYHTALQIYGVTFFQYSQVGFLKRLLNGSNPMAIVFYLNNGKTNTIMRNALIDFKFVTDSTANLKMRIRGLVFDFQNSSQGFYNTGKHLLLILLFCWQMYFKQAC